MFPSLYNKLDYLLNDFAVRIHLRNSVEHSVWMCLRVSYTYQEYFYTDQYNAHKSENMRLQTYMRIFNISYVQLNKI
jgi:hypothetical protein